MTDYVHITKHEQLYVQIFCFVKFIANIALYVLLLYSISVRCKKDSYSSIEAKVDQQITQSIELLPECQDSAQQTVNLQLIVPHSVDLDHIDPHSVESRPADQYLIKTMAIERPPVNHQSAKRGLKRANTTLQENIPPKKRNQATEKRPCPSVRFDLSLGHLPKIEKGRQVRCKNEDCIHKTNIKCSVCGVHLCICIPSDRNCFSHFHTLLENVTKLK